MWLEIMKPIALLLCLLSLYAVFHTMFLTPAITLEQRILHALELLAISAAISLTGGVIFSRPVSASSNQSPLFTTLPVQLFCWSTAVMLVLFTISWYLENYGVFYRDAHPWR